MTWRDFMGEHVEIIDATPQWNGREQTMSTYEKLLNAIREHSGMDDETIREAGEHGADAGWPGFTYTTDGAEFYRANADAIDEMLQNDADEMGYANVAEFVASFKRADMTDTRDGHDCLLAWYALETVGRSLESELI